MESLVGVAAVVVVDDLRSPPQPTMNTDAATAAAMSFRRIWFSPKKVTVP
ncbi:unannotated protein [freshwater metagenome]|uniref:Unannotated protein n=1 Tax=freshwater metagenome TaxID=449393 RepID=A0A6J7C7K6_9ZZZZ